MNNIFRQKSVDKISSPEQLNDYIRVTNPSIWIMLAAIIILLIGVISWSVFGTLDSKVTAVGNCKNGIFTCYVKDSNLEKIKEGMSVRIEGKIFYVESIGTMPLKVSKSLSEYLIYYGKFNAEDWVYEITLKTNLPDGEYKAEIIVESIKPVSFILN